MNFEDADIFPIIKNLENTPLEFISNEAEEKWIAPIIVNSNDN